MSIKFSTSTISLESGVGANFRHSGGWFWWFFRALLEVFLGVESIHLQPFPPRFDSGHALKWLWVSCQFPIFEAFFSEWCYSSPAYINILYHLILSSVTWFICKISRPTSVALLGKNTQRRRRNLHGTNLSKELLIQSRRLKSENLRRENKWLCCWKQVISQRLGPSCSKHG